MTIPRKFRALKAGMKIGHWTVLRRLSNDKKTKSKNLVKRVRVRCVCGTEKNIPVYYLRRKGNPKEHCGCLNKGLPTQFKITYSSWYMMNTRCQSEKHVAYKDYGGRGIQVCDQWHKDRADKMGFQNFLRDMGERPSALLTLDRIDVNGNYEKDNCRWATWEEQNNNKRRNLPSTEVVEDRASEELEERNIPMPEEIHGPAEESDPDLPGSITDDQDEEEGDDDDNE